MKFSIKNFLSKSEEIGSFLRIWSYLLKKSLVEHILFCAWILEQLPNTTFLKTLRYDYYLFYAAGLFLYPLKIPENLWYRKKNNQGGIESQWQKIN